MSHVIHHWRAETPAGHERPLFDSSPDGLRCARERGLVLTPATVCTSCHATSLHTDLEAAHQWADHHLCPGERDGEPWTREEDDAIKAGGRARDLAYRFGRTEAAIHKRRVRLRDGAAPQRPGWSRDELRLVAENRHLPAKQLLQLLPGRSLDAVTKKLTQARRALAKANRKKAA